MLSLIPNMLKYSNTNRQKHVPGTSYIIYVRIMLMPRDKKCLRFMVKPFLFPIFQPPISAKYKYSTRNLTGVLTTHRLHLLALSIDSIMKF